MIYFCADDYGLSEQSKVRIEKCLKSGVLNQIGILPNGEIDDFKARLIDKNVRLSLHLNLVEGRPLSKSGDIPLLVSLFLRTSSGNRSLSAYSSTWKLPLRSKKALKERFYLCFIIFREYWRTPTQLPR